jgi:hypothetical protein
MKDCGEYATAASLAQQMPLAIVANPLTLGACFF